MKKTCSIIIRTKNEERWISSCLKSVFNQSYKEIEVIIVDNKSTDKTLEKTKKFPNIKYCTIENYIPGESLNVGIRESTGEYIVCLSGHCIPVNNYWLENLVTTLESDNAYAGVYGRQEPMSFSSPADKRDMMIVFGLDQKIQNKDSFFHNANSILHRSLWNRVPFDSEISNIEDRVWAQEMLNLGYKIAYEPEASVYHYHGIHQNGDIDRCNNVVRIIENMQIDQSSQGGIDIDNIEIVALIAVKEKSWKIGDVQQMEYTIKAATQSIHINRVIVSTNNKELIKIATSLGAECPFVRSDYLTNEYISLETVYKDALEHIEKLNIYPDLVVTLEETFPFRDEELIDEVILHTLNGGYDTVIAAKRESGSLWQEGSGGNFSRMDSGDMPRVYKEKSFIGLQGLCCVTHPESLRDGNLIGNKVGLFEVSSPLASFEVRSENDRQIAKQLLLR